MNTVLESDADLTSRIFAAYTKMYPICVLKHAGYIIYKIYQNDEEFFGSRKSAKMSCSVCKINVFRQAKDV